MPTIPGNQSYSPTPQSFYYYFRTIPEFYNILGPTPGSSTDPLLTICNEIMCRILAENMPWKWNRETAPAFLTVSLQQDYCTNLTNIGWLENAWRVDINNSTSNNNGAPKPIFALETVRDLPQVSRQSYPFNICFVPNSQAFMGLWQANTAYSCGYGVSMTPRSPIQQFIDNNGNILFIDSTNLGLNIESPGYTGTTLLPPGAVFPYGVSGNTQPLAPANATPGTQIQDGTVIWTVADPNGWAWRLSPLPALNGLCWFIVPQYQVAPPAISTMQTSLAPIPNNMIYLFRAGVRAMLTQMNDFQKGNQMYEEWEETLMKAVRAADRQQDDNIMYPGTSIMGGFDQSWTAAGIGAAWPFGPSPLGS